MPGITPQVLEAAERFRAALLARERRAGTAMVRYYGEAWRRLQVDVVGLQAEVGAMRVAGETISPGRIWRLERMEAIQRQAAAEATRFAQFADDVITAGQWEGMAAGSRDAYQLALAGFPAEAGISISFSTMPREAAESLAGFLADGSPLRDLLVKAVGESADDFSQAMVTGLTAGWNPRRLARALRGEYGMGLTRALRISRTEQLRGYRTATLDSFRRSGVVNEWERHAAHDTRTCMACLVLDGKRYGLDEPMDDHVQGRCALLPITKTYAEMGIDAPEPDFQRELGLDWFLRQGEADQRLMMGEGVFEAWKEGRFQLGDMPKLVKNRVWGNSWHPKTLRELTGGDGLHG